MSHTRGFSSDEAVLATTGTGPGIAYASVELEQMLDSARAGMFHLRDRRPETYDLVGVT